MSLFPEQQKPAPHQGPVTKDRQPQRSPLELVDPAQRPDRVQPAPNNGVRHVPNSEQRLGRR
jgi:hypothetical protein